MDNLKRQQCIDALMASYEAIGAVNLSDRNIVPSRERIEVILKSLKKKYRLLGIHMCQWCLSLIKKIV